MGRWTDRLEGLNEIACTCELCDAVGPWVENPFAPESWDAAGDAALAAGWAREIDEELDSEGELVCRTVTWVCPACRPAFTTEDTENGG